MIYYFLINLTMVKVYLQIKKKHICYSTRHYNCYLIVTQQGVKWVDICTFYIVTKFLDLNEFLF